MTRSRQILLGLLGLAIAWDIYHGQWWDIIVGVLIIAAYIIGRLDQLDHQLREDART